MTEANQVIKPVAETPIYPAVQSGVQEKESSSNDVAAVEKPNIVYLMGFQKYVPPSLLCKHPPPAVRRDDDKEKLKEVLNDILLKSGHSTRQTND